MKRTQVPQNLLCIRKHQVTLVVNYDLPVKNNLNKNVEPDIETNLHRIGRSGRYGRKGAALNLLVTAENKTNMRKIEKHFEREIPEVSWDNDDGIEEVLKNAGLA